jgi:hypothetical protein
MKDFSSIEDERAMNIQAFESAAKAIEALAAQGRGQPCRSDGGSRGRST